jgi:hypothetical protein
MTLRPRVAYETEPVNDASVIHLKESTSELTNCGQPAAVSTGPLPVAKSRWPSGPRCTTCFQRLPLASPSRLRLP